MMLGTTNIKFTDTILFYTTMTSLNNPLQNQTPTKQYNTNISVAILEVSVLLTAVGNIHEIFEQNL